ncbi:phosphotransferase [Hamadaea sp. NPDC051192]|uniref:phosphotransferase n=1 Tax=Hamadaea sp. NPDC051192 TaxID=3154940 RepID=UPI00341B721E
MTEATFDVIPGRGLHTEAARADRLEWLRAQSGSALASLGPGRIDARTLAGNIENFTATVEIPVGLAGPLLFDGGTVQGPIVAPLATTEGALVASVARGARAITLGGGVRTHVLAQRMTRAPVYGFADTATAYAFTRWLAENASQLRERVGLVSRHATLVDVRPFQMGRYVHVRFAFETRDAAGQNMTTAATWSICTFINDSLADDPLLKPELFQIEGNLSGDKKVTQLSMIDGRGARVTAECFLDRATIAAVLKTTPEALDRAYRVGLLAALQAGMHGYTVNAANVIAAIFVATGQDIACVHESSTAILGIEPHDDGILATMLLPNLIVGTVGGGTRLTQQRDMLTALGCAGEGNAGRLAEIVAGFALALDLSTAAAITSGQFADAHQRLGRPREVRWLRPADVTTGLLQTLLAPALPGAQVTSVTLGPAVQGSGIITDAVATGEQRKLLGVLPLDLTVHDGRSEWELPLIAKLKPLDDEVVVAMARVASLCGDRVAQAWQRFAGLTGIKDAHLRELALYRADLPELASISPRCYGVFEDAGREAYALLLERLTRTGVVLLDTADRPELWATPMVEAAVDGIAPLHGRWLNDTDALLDRGWLGFVPGSEHVEKAAELWQALCDFNAAEHPDVVDAGAQRQVTMLIDEAGGWLREQDALPKTLIHNDFSPRNIALRRNGLGLVAFDWELATVGLPQRDLAELLCFTLTPQATAEQLEHYLERHRRKVAGIAGVDLDAGQWRRGFRFALQDLLMTRLQLYLMFHTHREQPFVPRVFRTARHLLQLTGDR